MSGRFVANGQHDNVLRKYTLTQFVITCDDCGLSEGINTAALDLHRRGIATAASVMTNCAAADHALKLFAEYPALEIGVHLNLTDGPPLTAAPDLTAAPGYFQPRYRMWLRGIVAAPAYLRAVEAELTAQIEACVQAGIQPQHLTTHLHFHVLPALREIVLHLAHRYGVVWLRNYHLRSTVLPNNPLLRPNQRRSVRPFNMPDYLVPLLYWKRQPPQRLAELLKRLPGTAEIVVHPCTAPDETFPASALYSAEERYREVKFLESLFSFLEQRRGS